MKICSASLIISEMQIKTTPHTCQNGYHQKVYTSQILERMWRKGNPCALLVRMQTGAATMENSMEVPQKTKDGISIWSSNSTPEYISRKIQQKDQFKRIQAPLCYSSTVYNSQDREATHAHQQMAGKRRGIYIHAMGNYSLKIIQFCHLKQREWI